MSKVNIKEYHRHTGSLIYLIVYTWPNIVYAVSIFSWHVLVLEKAHIIAIKCIFYYLHGTSYYRLEFRVKDNKDRLMEVFIDVD